MSAAEAPRLTAAMGRPSAPVRIVHLGLGNFFRAHQAWYTDLAPDAEQWGIAAFTGRRPDMAEALAPQDGRFTLITREASGDTFRVISSIVAVHAATEHEAFLGYLADPAVSIVTSTVTEAGYLRRLDGSLDVEAAAADLAAVKADPRAVVQVVPVKLVAGLLARRAAGAGAITILPCDNLPDNGDAVRQVVVEAASLVDETLPAWIDEHVEFGSTMVDRITPATTIEDVATVAQQQGYTDVSPVPTEPFSEWVIAADFPAGAPDWAAAGAQRVSDVAPHERRKLLLLNGAHSLIAYAGSVLGHETVADATGDARVRAWVKAWWDVARPVVGLPTDELDAYCTALMDRWSNPRIRHLLAQIAMDGSQKLPVRMAPVSRAVLADGGDLKAAVRPVAAWLVTLRGTGAPVHDAAQDAVLAAARGELSEAVPRVLALIDTELAASADAAAAVMACVEELTAH